jgi:hypothetical protein
MMKGGKFDVDKAFGTKNPQGETFADDFNKALPATVFPMGNARTDPTGDYATMGEMVRARYAYLSAQSGDINYSADRVQKAVNDVTGGVLSMNGGKFIAPRPGMPQTQFDGVMLSVTDNDLAGVTSLSGEPISADYLRSQARLESIGPGRYYVTLGRDQAAPIYAYSQQDNIEAPLAKFVLDLRGRQPPPFAAAMMWPPGTSVPGVGFAPQGSPPAPPATPPPPKPRGPPPAVGTETHFEPTGYGGIRG